MIEKDIKLELIPASTREYKEITSISTKIVSKSSQLNEINL
jgi:hypothetical protein